MKILKFISIALTTAVLVSLVIPATATEASSAKVSPRSTPPSAGPDLDLEAASATLMKSLDLVVFEIEVAGKAGHTTPEARGSLDGAPVLGYVFPTDLAPKNVGFRGAEGTVALAVTSHPDFDDTPLWDESGDLVYDNDGIVFHSHWVLLQSDERVAGGLSVIEFPEDEISQRLPPTNPSMPMYMDSPGFSIVFDGKVLRVLVPRQRLGGRADFRFDAVTAYLEVSTSGPGPLLGVHQVYEVLSGDLSLPYRVKAVR
ncbi:MAG: hypothetical protein AAF604_24200 [Acidobacteriota bacterium]